TFGGGAANWKKLAADENTDGSQSFIEIDFNTAPGPDTLVAPGNGANVHSLTPELRVSGYDPDGDALDHYFAVCTNADSNTCFYHSGWVDSDRDSVPAGLLNWNTTYYWVSYSSDGLDIGYPTGWWSFRTQNAPPAQASLLNPPEGQVFGTLSPTLSLNPVGDPDGDVVSYYIRISEAPDGLSGSTSDSGWMVAPNLSWTVPAGALVDGKKYYWTALAIDPYVAFSVGWAAPRSFRVDLGLGQKQSRPYDSLGPVSVNLSNGNLFASTSSPSFAAVGGSMGISYSYNSQSKPPAGLKGDYFRDDVNHNFSGERVLTRLDPNIRFDWGTSAPYPSMNPDDFSVRWTGYLTVPATGSYQWGKVSDDGIRLWVNNALV
ncbi:MAG: PA14 domain-containing protein, partial [Actinomycetota bacterium]